MRWMVVLMLLLTSCSAPAVKDESITAFAKCSSIQTRGMSADGLFLPCLDGGGEVALGSIEGPAMLSVWASWCTNCESQRPYLLELFQNSQDKLQLIGIDVEEKNQGDGLQHALKKGMAYPQLFDPDGRTTKVFGPGVPITQFIDAQGIVAYMKVGPFTSYSEIRELVKKYLKIELT